MPDIGGGADRYPPEIPGVAATARLPLVRLRNDRSLRDPWGGSASTVPSRGEHRKLGYYAILCHLH